MKRDQIIVVLGGYIVKGADGCWRTTNFEEHDPKTALGDRLRVVAASFLYKHERHALPMMNLVTIIVSGGKGEFRGIPEAPTIASVNEDELIMLGVPSSEIIREEQSNTTYGQLVELTKLLETMPVGTVTIISNQYHLPRIRAMIEVAEPFIYLRKLLGSRDLIIVSAEDICLSYDRATWGGIVTSAYASEAMVTIQANEARGVEDIRQGRYRFR